MSNAKPNSIREQSAKYQYIAAFAGIFSIHIKTEFFHGFPNDEIFILLTIKF